MTLTKNNLIKLIIFIIGWLVIAKMLKTIFLLIASLIDILALPLAILFAFILMLIILDHSTR